MLKHDRQAMEHDRRAATHDRESSAAPAAPTDAVDRETAAGVELLRQVLLKQHELHGALLESLEAKREAIRTADLERLTEAGRVEEALTQQILTLEQQRGEIVDRLAQGLGIQRESVTVREIIAAIPSELGEGLAAAADRLRERARSVKECSSTIRQAAESLSQHLAGLVRTIQGALSQAGVYGRGGRMNPGDQVRSSLDLRT